MPPFSRRNSRISSPGMTGGIWKCKARKWKESLKECKRSNQTSGRAGSKSDQLKARHAVDFWFGFFSCRIFNLNQQGNKKV